jgi:dTDP-4-dehydrorhamnose reductase
VRAVTVWSLLGAYDWDRLLTAPRGHYEPGAFDLRAPAPRATAIAAMARALATDGGHEHPVLGTPGWWRRRERVWYEPFGDGGEDAAGGDAPPIVVTGRTGTLGRAFGAACEARGLQYRLLSRGELDIADGAAVAAALDAHDPWAVVNTAGYVRVDDAELELDRCRRENADGPAELARACAERGIRLVTFSSDLVFDGAKRDRYVESDIPAPLSVYGQTKVEAERRVLDALPSSLVVRTSAFFGPHDAYNFVTLALEALAAGETFRAADDVVVSATYVPALVDAALDLLIDDESGIWHLACGGETTWYDLARDAAEAAAVDASSLVACPARDLGWIARRPAYSALGSERGWPMPSLVEALARYADERERNLVPVG